MNGSLNATPAVIISAFGGWIMAVITFYFAGQQAAGTQKQVDNSNKQALNATSIAASATESASSLSSSAKALKDKHVNAFQEFMTLLEQVSPEPAAAPVAAAPGGTARFAGAVPEAKMTDFSELKGRLQAINKQLEESSKEFDKNYAEIQERLSKYRTQI